MLIYIKGAGDLATGVARRLHSCGFQIVMTETAQPTTVRCTVAFSRAVYQGSCEVEGVTARLAADADEACAAILAKRNTGTCITDAPAVIGLGPGFEAGVDCHAVIETKRGHSLGSVIYEGRAIANTGVPGNIGGFTSERILRASGDGIFKPVTEIGHLVREGDIVAYVGELPVRARIGGVVRGLLPDGTPVHTGMKSGDVDPRGIVEYCYTISDKARAIAGGALEAVLHLLKGRVRL